MRDPKGVATAIALLEIAAETGRGIVEASIGAAKAGVTTGEWSAVMRAVLGEYRAPTGVSDSVIHDSEEIRKVRERVAMISNNRAAPLRMLVGKPGLDGHSNGAEQIAVRARDCGFEVIYQGIRLSPQDIVSAAIAEDVDVIGLSILSGSHRTLVQEILEKLQDSDAGDIPVVVGGIIPPEDAQWLLEQGVRAVFTPRDYDATQIMNTIVDVIDA